jgi:hypothetical protein
MTYSELRYIAISMYENVISKFRNNEGWLEEIIVIYGLRNIVLCLLPFLEFILTN